MKHLTFVVVLASAAIGCGDECTTVEVRGDFDVPSELNVLYFRVDDIGNGLVTGDSRELVRPLPATLGVCKGERTPEGVQVSVTGYLGTVEEADPVAQTDRVPLAFDGGTVSINLVAY